MRRIIALALILPLMATASLAAPTETHDPPTGIYPWWCQGQQIHPWVHWLIVWAGYLACHFDDGPGMEAPPPSGGGGGGGW